ncbi:MAG: hypothetical protein ACP5RE_03705 [Candidatus Acidifodinimicrobium sp.]
MLNGNVLGQKFYVARNPIWTKLGRAGKPMLGLRANNQKPGLGVGNQGVQRARFAQSAMGLYGTTGKDARGMPMMAVKMSSALGGYHPEKAKAAYEAKRQAAHSMAQARWGGVVPSSGAGQSLYGGRF